MSPSRARFVTACQQLLALGVVVVALVPATRVVSLDVVGVHPGQSSGQPSVGIPQVSVSARQQGAGCGRDRTGRVGSTYARYQWETRCALAP
jgi:hypothetical protein